MDVSGPTRPRISRETRLLLATILISVAALWALARIRFPNRPATPNPVPPLLTQLAAPPAFDDLAAEVSKIESRLLPSLVVVEVSGSPRAALRVRDDVGVVLLDTSGSQNRGPRSDDRSMLAFDGVAGVATMRIPGAPAPELTPWSPERSGRPRYMIASDVSSQGPSLRPVFVGRMYPIADPSWPGEIWVLPAQTDITPGAFLFTMDGAMAGLVVPHAGTPALVPGDAVLGKVETLLRQKASVPGSLGVEVQALTASLASASGASAGVMIVSVDPKGPAAEKLAVMDVIEAAGREPITSLEDWRVRLARLVPDESIVLRVRRRGETQDVTLTAAGPPAPGSQVPLGLIMRTLGGVGAEILRVADLSAAARGGLREGDVITAIGDIHAPSATQVARAFAADDRPILVAVTRDRFHYVLALEKK